MGEIIVIVITSPPWRGRRPLHHHHHQDQHHLHHHLRDPLRPLVVWELLYTRYLSCATIHVCDWVLVIIWWWSYIFRLCCTTYTTEYHHVCTLWVVPVCSWGHRMNWQWFIYDMCWYFVYCLSFYVILWWCCANVDCTTLHLYGLIGEHRSVMNWGRLGGTCKLETESWSCIMRVLVSGTLECNAMVGLYVLIIFVQSFTWPHDPS